MQPYLTVFKPFPPFQHLQQDSEESWSGTTDANRRETLLKMASPRTVTIVALSFALGLFFVFMGTIKLTPRLSKDAYSEMVSDRRLAIMSKRRLDANGFVLGGGANLIVCLCVFYKMSASAVGACLCNIILILRIGYRV